MTLIAIDIKQYQITKVCNEHGISPPFITISDEHLEQDGQTVFGRALSFGVVKLYRGSFDAAYRGAVEKAGGCVWSEALLKTLSAKATHILLHELWHCKQLESGRHSGRTHDEAEAEAEEFADANEALWPDLVSLSDTSL